MTGDRLSSEFQLLCRRYGEMEHGENRDWVMFREFPLSPGWNVETTELLVVIPPGYPTTPPDNFFVSHWNLGGAQGTTMEIVTCRS